MSERHRIVEEHLRPAEAALRLSVNESTIHRWIKARKIRRVVKIGRHCLLIPASELNRFLTSQTI